jgi:DNA-binding SARP family transcriptional activator/tetratricopeptide (TPR) repeat protein
MSRLGLLMIELRMLGGVELHADDGIDPDAILAHPKRLALLAYLAAARPYGLHQRDSLVALFWPELDQSHARAALRQTLHRLRASIGARAIVTRGDEVIGIDEDVVWCDVRAFDAATRLENAVDAFALYRGEFLPGVFAADAPAFERWIDAERRQLRSGAAQVAWVAADRAERDGDAMECAAWGVRAVRLTPDNEQGARRLIALLERVGDRGGAIRVYEELERYLATELDVAPSPETTALIAKVRASNCMPARREQPRASAPEDRAERSAIGAQLDDGPSTAAAPPSSDRRGATTEHAPGSAPSGPPRVRRIALVAAAAAVVLLVGGIALYRGTRPVSATRPRIVVMPLDNRTGDATLDVLSMLSADWIERGLLEPGFVEVVPAEKAAELKAKLATRPGPAGVILPRRVANETGAGLVVYGAFYAAGNRIRFELSLADAAQNRLLGSFEAVSALARDPMAALDTLRRRVTGGVAQIVNPDAPERRWSATPPPSYDAYKLVIDARRSSDPREAERHLRGALALEPTYQSARVVLAILLMNLDELQETDSLIRIVEHDTSRLGRGEREVLKWIRANLNGDREASYQSMREQASITGALKIVMQVGHEAAMLNRPHEALATYARVDPRNPQMAGDWYWRLVTDAYDAIGDHDHQLAAAKESRRMYPTLLSSLELEALALAASHRAPEAEALVLQSIDLPRPGSRFSPGKVAREVALELRAYGDSAAADRIAAWGVRWYESLPREEQLASRQDYADVLYAAQRWRDTRVVMDEICARSNDTLRAKATFGEIDCIGWAGLLAARLGERDRARAADEQLAAFRFGFRVQEGGSLMWRARIAAVLGERDHATGLLRQAYSRGLGYGDDARDPEYRLLRGYPPFDAFMRPKG